MKHPEWVPPHSEKWYTQLGTEIGEYKYPWKSHFDEPTAAMVFTEKISQNIGKDGLKKLKTGRARYLNPILIFNLFDKESI